MKAITLVPGTTEVRLSEMNEPQITQPDHVKIRIAEVGICGTDREEAEGGRASAPPGKKELVLGHEMFGQVVETGSAVTSVKAGDYGVFTVRRGCGECAACATDRSDMCYSGNYTERGINGADGFQSEYVVDEEKYFIAVPEEIKHIGVLTEPMSVAAKAIDEAVQIQCARLPDSDMKNWLKDKKALVAGIGAIGLMAAIALRLKGAEVYGLDIVDKSSLRPGLLEKLGGFYIDSRNTGVKDIDTTFGPADVVFEATGISKLQLQLIDTLATNGIYVATGIPGGKRPVSLKVDGLMEQLVLKNQVMLGSVNASPGHYRMAVDLLQAAHRQYPEVMQQIITERFSYADFEKALEHHSVDEIKVVVDWTASV